MTDYVTEFIAFMRDHGCGPAVSSDISPSDKWKDYQIDSDRKGKKKGFYTLRIDGDYVSGACGDRRSGEVYQYRGKPARKLTDDERREYAKRRDADRKARAADDAARQDAAAIKSKARWDKAKTGDHPYLTRKGIDGLGSRVSGEFLLVPMFADGKLWGVQSIDHDGGKMFPAGGRKKGCYCPIALGTDDKSTIYITEGFATGASVRTATGAVVVVAFDAGNLLPVAEAMRVKYPDAVIVIAGDNDTSGTGQTLAAAAARAVAGFVVLPDTVDKDWNDLALEIGLDSVAAMLADRTGDVPGSADPPLDAVVADSVSSPPDWEVPLHVYEREYRTLEMTQVDDWRMLLITNSDGKLIKSSLKNVILFLENHDELSGLFRLNEFQQEIFVHRCPKWEAEGTFEVHRLEDNDITQTAAAIERFGLGPDCDRVYKAIRVVAERNGFHPAREYFNGLEWDGTARLDKWLSYYMGAEGDDPDYLGFIGKKWLTAAVKRVYEPGCKYDHILVMEGEQGRGKSTAFEYLATFGRDKQEAYFTDNIKLSDIQNKDTILMLQGSIIVELAELAGFKKQEDDEIKGWITTKEDRCRVPYAKTITHFPRQFVLCGTTNNYDYLKDPTGNRRYWPFKSSNVDLESIKNDREQLWAEAVSLYRGGLYIGPTDDEAALAKIAQDKRLTVDTWEDDVLAAVADLGLNATRGFNTRDIYRGLGLGLKDQDFKNTRRINNILQQNGYSNEIRRLDGKTRRVWVRP